MLSPSFAAAGAFPAVHEQAMRRLAEVTGLVPVEFPATRKVGATSAERAADVYAAFADPGIRAILAVVGGDDQITVIPHARPELGRQFGVRQVQHPGGRAHQHRGGVRSARLGEAGPVVRQLRPFPDRQPRKAAAHLPGADERPLGWLLHAFAAQSGPSDSTAH